MNGKNKSFKIVMRRIAIFSILLITAPTILQTLLPKHDTGLQIIKEATVSADENTDNSSVLSETETKELSEFSEQNADQMIDVQNMNSVQKEAFRKIIEENVNNLNLPTQEDVNDFVDMTISVYDSNSDNYQDISSANDQLIDELDENHDSISDSLSGEKILAAGHGSVSVSFLGSVLDAAIGAVVGGGAGAALALVRRKGVAYVRNLVYSRVKASLVNVGLGRANVVIMAGLEIALGYYSPGNALARWTDSRDKIRNNGWIELW